MTRQLAQTSPIRAAFEGMSIGNDMVVEVGDLVWWPCRGETILLGAVKLRSGKCLALGYENGTFMVPLDSRESWVLNSLQELPRLELEDDHIAVYFTNERYLMAMHAREYGTLAPPCSWRYSGIGSGGLTALRQFEKHDMTLTVEHD